jgi:hypothetical protein
MFRYRLTFTNDKDRQINVRGDDVAECIKNLQENASWEKWEATLKYFNYTPEEIEEERKSGFYLGA